MARGMQNGSLKLQMPDMSAYKPVEPKMTVNNNSSIQIGSLITINGDADQNTVNQIREIAESLVKNK